MYILVLYSVSFAILFQFVEVIFYWKKYFFTAAEESDEVEEIIVLNKEGKQVEKNLSK